MAPNPLLKNGQILRIQTKALVQLNLACPCSCCGPPVPTTPGSQASHMRAHSLSHCTFQSSSLCRFGSPPVRLSVFPTLSSPHSRRCPWGRPPGCAEDEAAAWAPLIPLEMLEGHQEAVVQHVEFPEEGGVQFHLPEEPAPLGPCWSISASA